MWPEYSAECRRAVNNLLRAGGSLSAYRANKDYGAEPKEGSYAWKLEREIQNRFGVLHAVAVNSGTAALHAALAALGRLDGREVITSPYSFSATVSAILLAGGVPRFADVDPNTFCITKETVKPHVTKRTAAILPVHLFGSFQSLEPLREFDVPIVEDACQAVGARRGNFYSGCSGLAGAYSFNGTKNIPAGEAGCLVTNDAEVARKARLLSNHAENFGVDRIGLNYRPNEVTCCIAYHGLLELEERNQRRQELAGVMGEHRFYHDDLERDAAFRYDKGDHVYYVYPFKVRKGRRDQFIKAMEEKGIPVGAGYIQPTLQHYKAFRKYARGPLPVVEELSKKTLCILSTLTPDRPLSYAVEVAKAMRECLER
jgi:dTDP-4-amino-4,6-dideoxygalactose transaminase